MKEENEFHQNYWQGKRKDQVQKSYKGFAYSLIGLLIFVVIYTVIEIFKNL